MFPKLDQNYDEFQQKKKTFLMRLLTKFVEKESICKLKFSVFKIKFSTIKN